MSQYSSSHNFQVFEYSHHTDKFRKDNQIDSWSTLININSEINIAVKRLPAHEVFQHTADLNSNWLILDTKSKLRELKFPSNRETNRGIFKFPGQSK